MRKKQPAEKPKYKLDAKGQVLGRLASEAAKILQGKNLPQFEYYQPSQNKVIIYNAKEIILTGRKKETKSYWRHSGYPGGLKEIKAGELLETKPEEVIRRAILGMLPKNKLRKIWLKNLKIFQGEINE